MVNQANAGYRKIDSIKDPGYAALTGAAKAPVSGADEMLLDGVPLLETALGAGLRITHVIWDENEALKDYAAALNVLLAAGKTDVMVASSHLMKRLDIAAATPKCAFLVSKGEECITSAEEVARLGRVLALAGVADLMNIGVLLRHAEAFGYAVVACEGTPPLNARQVIRSGTGSGLRKPFYRAVMPVDGLVLDLRALGVLTISTSAHAATPVTDISWRSPHMILVGNETHGLDPDVRRAAETDAVIPMVPGGAHSINVAVASSIMMFEGMKNSH